MDLSGKWWFELDPEDTGLSEGWQRRRLAGEIRLPGSLQAQGFGNEVTLDTAFTGDIHYQEFYTAERFAPYRQPGNIKMPFWLQAERYYMGAAWYQRAIAIPDDWLGARVELFLERPHWETRVWLDEIEIVVDRSLSTPHVYDLGTGILPGEHVLTIRVDNRMIINVGPNSHSVSDHTQTNWNGITGQIELRKRSPLWLEDIQLYPDVANRTIRVQMAIRSALPAPVQARLLFQASFITEQPGHLLPELSLSPMCPPGDSTLAFEYQMGEQVELWDEFHPALYQADLYLRAPHEGIALEDHRSLTFGLREVGTEERQGTVNRQKTFLRGTLECCIFPLTGYPPCDVASWQRIIRTCQEHGLNLIRFHSYCPPEAAFIAGDELGMYFQVECASWANQGAEIGMGGALDGWLYEEAHRIIKAYGNHPSFLMMSYGNEPVGKMEEYLTHWVTFWQENDPRRLHTSGTGWPVLPESDYHSTPAPRIQAWGEGNASRINARPPETETDYRSFIAQFEKPVISHEIGQWCVFPNFDEIAKYSGYLKAKIFEIFRDLLGAHHMADQSRDFLMASGKLQVLCYKEEIESTLRTQGFGGFQLLDLHDFPGQGTALVGVLDAFWESKGYVTPEEYRRFCSSTVLLARMNKRYWKVSETLFCAIRSIRSSSISPPNIIRTGSGGNWRMDQQQ